MTSLSSYIQTKSFQHNGHRVHRENIGGPAMLAFLFSVVFVTSVVRISLNMCEESILADSQ